ncbi:MAG: B12-binding domain-containing protein [Gemmobacter sp.]
MQEFQQRIIAHRAPLEGEGVARFASHVLTLLADRGTARRSEIRMDIVDRLTAAVIADDTPALEALLRDMRLLRISAVVLADHYIPEAARRMGEAWHQDRLGFAEVTIGSARLQAMLRQIGQAWAADMASHPRGAILVIVPQGEQHTLGALVVANQARRLGFTTRLLVGPQLSAVSETLRDRRFDVALVSVAGDSVLENAGKLVETVRRSASAALPVLVGGSVMSRRSDAAEVCGADAAFADLGKGLHACGIATGVRETA